TVGRSDGQEVEREVSRGRGLSGFFRGPGLLASVIGRPTAPSRGGNENPQGEGTRIRGASENPADGHKRQSTRKGAASARPLALSPSRPPALAPPPPPALPPSRRIALSPSRPLALPVRLPQYHPRRPELVIQQPAFSRQAAAVADQRAVLADDAVAGDEDRQVVRGDEPADLPRM